MGEPGSLEGCTSMGPWGGPGGSKFNFCVKGGIKQIVIVHGHAVDSIIFKGDNGDGVLKESNEFGGNGGGKTDKIDIAWPREYLTSITGSYGTFNLGGPVAITSLCFITNRTKYGPFGTHPGTSFSSTPIEGSAIVGFHGRAGQYFDAIGVYAKPISGCPKNQEGDLRCLGPWGGLGGSNEWSFSVKGGIKQITIAHGDVVDSILFKGDDGNGVLKDSEKFGSSVGGSKTEIDIDWPKEYLTSISGTCVNYLGQVVIKSLCFYTNRATYGPFGKNSGTSFSMPVEAGSAIVGFHGRYGTWLDAIGVYTKPREGDPHSLEGCISLGPWGGSGGNKWSFSVKGGIKQIVIVCEKAVDSILFKIIDNGNGSKEYSKKFGGSGGSTTYTVDIDWPKEYLTSISGTYGSVYTSGLVVITSLCFNTNLTIHGRFGCNSGTSFSIPMEGGSIVGFHGHADQLIDAIGVYVKPIGKGCQKNEEVIDAILKVVVRDIGPWGGLSGNAWDDGVFSAAKQILVHVGNGGAIRALQFQYEKLDGKPFLSEKRGGPGGATIYRINLECASEFIAGISGFYGPIEGSNGLEAIRSISFHTNKGTYGPFGKEIGKCFSSGFGGKVVGFHGRSNVYLDAIGVHMAYF